MYLGPFCYNGGLFPSSFLAKGEGRDHLENINIERRIILKWILNK
jgi:hypothetical protein